MEKKELVLSIKPSSVIITLLIIALAVALYTLRDLLLVILTAIVIAAAVEPITRWFKQYRIPRVPAVILIYAFVAILFVGIFYFLLLPLLGEAASFLSVLPQYIDQIDLWSPIGEQTAVGSQQIVQDLSSNFSLRELITQINSTLENASQGLLNTISIVFGGVLSFVLIVTLSFYLAVQEDGIATFLKTVTPLKNRDYVLSVWQRVQKKIGLWLQGQVLLVVIVAILTYLGLSLLKVEHALLLAVLAGLFEIIPLFGPILASIPAILIAVVNGGVVSGLMVGGLYVIIQQFENQLIYPLVVKKVVGVPALIVIVALIAGGTLAGFLGVLLSVPVAALLMELFTDLQKERTVHKKIQDNV